MKPTTWIVSALLVGLLMAPLTFAELSGCEILSESETWGEAFKACKKSADSGSPKAQFYLAEMYASGNGVEQDSVKALKLFERAASNGVGLAQLALGNAYYYAREIVLQDFHKAAKWYERAAYNGVPFAQYMIGSLYGEGKGVEKDDVRAHMWVNVASANGYDGASDLRDLIAVDMQLDDVERAQRLAKRCLESQYADCG